MNFSHTFVVPSHNHGAYIGRTIESLLRQTQRGSEIVVCEDHSTDHTMQVLEGFRDRIRIVRPPEHRGMAHAWNWGVQHARGEWVSIMGADDVALPDFVATINAALKAHPGAVLASGEVNQIDGEDRYIGTLMTLSARRVTSPPETLYMQAAANMVQAAAHCFRRDGWEKTGGFDTRLEIFGDWGLWLKLAPLGDFVHLHRVIANYRINYRPGLVRERMPQTMRDRSTIQRVIIPEVASKMPDVDAGRLRKASLQCFRAMLADASSVLEVQDRQLAADCMSDWAAEIGAEALLGRFVSGERVSTGWRGSSLRRALRQIYQQLFMRTAHCL
jgi:glycosyltransferase involved in cell wall biosynthesis